MGKDRKRYDEVPVYYCKRCLSLDIRIRPGVGDYCAKCGGASIGSASIAEHQRLMSERISSIKDGRKD